MAPFEATYSAVDHNYGIYFFRSPTSATYSLMVLKVIPAGDHTH